MLRQYTRHTQTPAPSCSPRFDRCTAIVAHKNNTIVHRRQYSMNVRLIYVSQNALEYRCVTIMPQNPLNINTYNNSHTRIKCVCMCLVCHIMLYISCCSQITFVSKSVKYF